MTTNPAADLAACTGARTVTHYTERRNPDGTLTAEAVQTFTRSEGREHWLWRQHRTFYVAKDTYAFRPTYNVYDGTGYIHSRHETLAEADTTSITHEANHIARYPASSEPAYTD